MIVSRSNRLLLCAALILASASVAAANAKRVSFGNLDDGTAIAAVELRNSNGVTVRILTLGATIQALEVPDRDGKVADVVLGYATAAEYLAKPQYFGATVGRYANRIGGATFHLDGETFVLEKNDGPNHLHGGVRGLDKVVWETGAIGAGDTATAVFTYSSPDGAGGYPGKLDVTAVFTLTDSDELGIEYRAITDKATIVNITNHSYFNLAGAAGDRSILDHELTLFADQFTPVDETLIPTGELRPVADSPFDFRTAKRIGDDIRDASDEQMRFGRGYDHNWVINDANGELRLAAVLHDPQSGRVMELLTTAPGMQFYSGNFLDGRTVGKNERANRQGDALCLEPQVFPDAPNRPDFPSARLEPGETYRNAMVFRFSSR
jgi:aldose 1-epimerase